jgi:hypothetical protein
MKKLDQSLLTVDGKRYGSNPNGHLVLVRQNRLRNRAFLPIPPGRRDYPSNRYLARERLDVVLASSGDSVFGRPPSDCLSSENWTAFGELQQNLSKVGGRKATG